MYTQVEMSLKSIVMQPMAKGYSIHITKITLYFNKTNNNKGLYSTEKKLFLDRFLQFSLLYINCNKCVNMLCIQKLYNLLYVLEKTDDSCSVLYFTKKLW